MDHRIRVVTFDAMKTLISVRKPIGEIYSEFAQNRYQIHVDPDLLQKSFWTKFRSFDQRWPCFGFYDGGKTGDTRSVDDLRENIGNDEASTTILNAQRRWWINLVKETFASVTPNLDAEHLNSLCVGLFDYFGTTEPWVLNSSAKSILDISKRKGISCAVVSNFDSRLRRLLSQFKLDDYFHGYFLSGETGVAKPKSELFRMVERIMMADPKEILHVGDDVEKDYFAAKSAGWRAVIYKPRGEDLDMSKVECNDVISDLLHLKSKIS